jgi:arylsulfatase A-like enzyme
MNYKKDKVTIFSLGKWKYLIIVVVISIIFIVSAYFIYRNSYIESEYFFLHFPFAKKSYSAKIQNTSANKLNIIETHFHNKNITAIKLPINCSLAYYLKVPRSAKLNFLFKPYGPQKTLAKEDFTIFIQEEEKPAELLFSYIFSKGFNKEKWKTSEVSLNDYRGKIVKLTFNIIKSIDPNSHPEGLYIRPLLLLNKFHIKSSSMKDDLAEVNLSQRELNETNIILIVLDAARPDHFSSYGYHRLTTPFIDELAKEGVLFENAYSVAPYTIASTASLFTSLYPNTHHVTRWWKKIPQRMKTLAEILAKQGYATYGSGFVMDWGEWANKGFKQIFDLDISTKENLGKDLTNFFKEEFAEIKFNRPAFFYIHIRPPHADYNPPDEFDKWSLPELRKRYVNLTKVDTLLEIDKGVRGLNQKRLQFLIDKYDGNLLWADHIVQQIVEHFKEQGLYRNSILIISSDHGEAFWEHEKLLHNSTVYNEMIKIPLIIKFPHYKKSGKKVINAQVENIDIMPTVLEFLQIDYSNLSFQGKSLIPLVFGEAQEVKEYGFVRGFWPEMYSIYDSHYKYIRDFEKKELYDLKNDVHEKVNLASSKPIILRYYQSLAQFYRAQLIRARREKPDEAKLDEETIIKLRSLGYLQ